MGDNNAQESITGGWKRRNSGARSSAGSLAVYHDRALHLERLFAYPADAGIHPWLHHCVTHPAARVNTGLINSADPALQFQRAPIAHKGN